MFKRIKQNKLQCKKKRLFQRITDKKNMKLDKNSKNYRKNFKHVHITI